MSDTTINRLTMAKAEGKRLRKKVAREDHATLELPKHRDVLDPVSYTHLTLPTLHSV